MTLAEFIRSHPEIARTQEEWAAHFGLSRPYLSQILSGERSPGRKAIATIAERTGGAVPPGVWFAPLPAQGADAA